MSTSAGKYPESGHTVHGTETGPDMEYEPEEDDQPRDEGELTLIDPEMFWDLLMEQQEQM